jgi:hypothetical protein
MGLIVCIGVIPRQKYHRITNRHLANDDQEGKTGHAKVGALMEEGKLKKEVKKVNMVDILSIQEWKQNI